MKLLNKYSFEKINQFIVVFIVTVVFLTGCNRYDAEAPVEKTTTNIIPQDSSTISIPIDISTQRINQLVIANAPNPLAEGNPSVSMNIASFVLVPRTITDIVIEKGLCDVSRKVRVSWKCVFCPSCCFTVILVKEACDIKTEVTRIVNDKINKMIPTTANIFYRLQLNDLQIEGNGNDLRVHVTLDIKMKADVDLSLIQTGVASCGIDEEMPQIELILNSKVNFGETGNFIISEKKWDQPNWKRPCNLTALDVKAEDILNLPFIKQMVEEKLDELAKNKIPSEVNITDKLAKVWPKISKPIKVGSLGFINLNISQLNTSNIFISRDDIKTEIGAVCKPQFLLSENIAPSDSVPAPNLGKKALPNGFSINVLGTASLTKLNEFARPAFNDLTRKVNNKLLKITNFKIYQSEEKLVIEIDLQKPYTGKIYLFGVPQFDTQNNILSFKKLDYALNSQDIIGKQANWIIESGHDYIKEIIMEKFQYKYEKNILEGLEKLRDVNQEITTNVFLRGKLDKISPTAIKLSDNNLNVVVNASGIAFVEVR